jgi:hypothetical protein
MLRPLPFGPAPVELLAHRIGPLRGMHHERTNRFRSCLKTKLLLLIAKLPTMIGQNRPQAGSYVNKTLILLGQFFDSL